jgi:hypothetical protein
MQYKLDNTLYLSSLLIEVTGDFDAGIVVTGNANIYSSVISNLIKIISLMCSTFLFVEISWLSILTL